MNDRIQAAKSIDMLGLVEKTTRLKKVATSEWAGACPKCGGKDRFRVDPDKGWFCRKCTGEPGSGGHWQDQIDFVMWLKNIRLHQALTELTGDKGFTKQELEQIASDRQKRENERLQIEQMAAGEARSKLNQSGDWRKYAAHPMAIETWSKRGITADWVAYYGLGYCEERQYPFDDRYFVSDSLTIPYFRHDEIEGYYLIDMKHRLLKSDSEGGKYRHHLRNLGNNLFFADILAKKPIGDLLIVEGEIKAIITWQACWLDSECLFPNLSVVSVPGKNWKQDWIDLFKSESIERIFICLDPDANKESDNFTGNFTNSVSIKLPAKIDDLIQVGALDMWKMSSIMENAWSGKHANL